jgi:hypothetical protein
MTEHAELVILPAATAVALLLFALWYTSRALHHSPEREDGKDTRWQQFQQAVLRSGRYGLSGVSAFVALYFGSIG